MKTEITAFFIMVLCTVIPGTFAQSVPEISLQSGWRFQKGDHPGWKNPNFDDTGWREINPTGYWDYLPEFADYDGYGWYRISVFIPSELKNDMSNQDVLHIRLGRVDDNDQTFLNGILIGENARNTSSGHENFAGELGAYAKVRDYTLPLSHPAILWDDINVIAVRAYDFYLTGGLTTTDLRLFVREGWSDNITLDRKTTWLSRLHQGRPFAIQFAAGNKAANKTYKTTFFAEITLKETGKSVATFDRDLVLPADSTVITTITFTPYIQTDYEILYRLTDQCSGLTLVEKDLLGVFMPAVKLRDKTIRPKVEDTVEAGFFPVNFSEIRVNGLLGEKMDLNLEKGLLNIPYQLIEPHTDGIVPPWPVGEFVGKLLHGNTKMLRYSRDQRLLAATSSVIQLWIEAQQDDGYLGTNPPDERWKGWDVWDHKYLLLALLNYHSITGYRPAMDAAIKIGDLVTASFGCDDNRLDIVDGYHAGMASGSILESMVYLYKHTGEKKYLDFCRYIVRAFEQDNGPKIISELTMGSRTVPEVGNAKGYEMLSCLIGLVQLYKVTGEKKLIEAVNNGWDDIQKNRLYITGTATASEHFQKTGELPAGEHDNMGETCVTAHWMYLSKELFKLYGEQKYIDEIEKSLYNHLLAAQHPVSGDIVYYAALQHRKWYMEPDMYIGPPLCCHMSAKRCLTEIPEFSYYKAENELGVLLYNPSQIKTTIKTFDEKAVSVRVTVKSNYPAPGPVTLAVRPESDARFILALRVPDWCGQFTAVVGDERVKGIPGEFLKLGRIWNKFDTVQIQMQFPLTVLHGGKSYPDHYALKYGTQILAFDTDVNAMQDADRVFFDRGVKPDIRPFEGPLPDGWIGQQAFISNVIKTITGQNVVLVPYADAGQTGGDIRIWIRKM